jgi:tRNA pseudouridine13 synthase
LFSLLFDKMLHACGITSFLNELPAVVTPRESGCADVGAFAYHTATHPCVTGVIKAVAEDFVVVEIDPTGQRTDAVPYVFPAVGARDEASSTLSRAEDAVVVDDEGISEQNDTLSPNQAVFSRNQPAPARSLEALRDQLIDHAPLLRRLFGNASDVGQRVATSVTQIDLTALIRDMNLSAQGALPLSFLKNDEGLQSATTAVSSSSPATASANPPRRWWRGSYRLGEFVEKKERQMVHLLVRRCFPHLRSYAAAPLAAASSSPSSVAVASVISCSLDLHYVLFCATLGVEAALCIARWAISAQAARQERQLDDETRNGLQAVTPLEDSLMPVSVDNGVCIASFDALTEVMRQPIQEAVADELLLSSESIVSGDSCPSSHDREKTPLLSDKDVRRCVHETLRRFYPFIRCQVRDGTVVLRYSPKAGSKSTAAAVAAAPVSSSSPSTPSARGVRRPREESDDAEAEAQGADEDAALTPPAAGFLHLVVKKRNLDTAEMRQLIGEYCGQREGAVCAAGMKDKKAVTTQRCSIPCAPASTTASTTMRMQKGCVALAAAAPASPVVLRWPADPQNSYAAVLCAAPRSGPVHLGQLQGNWFSVHVRGVRWATAAERQQWSGRADVQAAGLTESTANLAAAAAAAAHTPEGVAGLRTFVEERFRQCVERGFINYFGQQRFGETIERADDHTGVHLFAGRWVAAVRSLYRACPDVYDAFPERMEARFVPGNSRDAQVMTHALHQTYRMYFSEHPLTRDDVQTSSALWTRLCEKAVTTGVAYFLRSLWVHAGQSVFFNLAASFVVDGMHSSEKLMSAEAVRERVATRCIAEAAAAPRDGLSPLPSSTVVAAYLPLGGYQVAHSAPREHDGVKDNSNSSGDNDAVWQAWKEAAIEHALRTLRWTRAHAFEQRKVAGVPVPGSWRAVVVRPRDAVLQWQEKGEAPAIEMLAEAQVLNEAAVLPCVRLSFGLPSSSYATVFLREVLGCDKWW